MRSVFSALVVATLILLFAVHVIAPGVPLVVGRAAVTDERTLRWEHARLLLVVNRNGSVRVTATEEGEVSLRAVARIYERSPRDGDEARAYAEQLLSTTQDGEWTTVRSEPEERPDNLEVRTDLELRVPPEVPLVLQVENGNVSAGPGVGPLTIQGLNADV